MAIIEERTTEITIGDYLEDARSALAESSAEEGWDELSRYADHYERGWLLLEYADVLPDCDYWRAVGEAWSDSDRQPLTWWRTPRPRIPQREAATARSGPAAKTPTNHRRTP